MTISESDFAHERREAEPARYVDAVPTDPDWSLTDTDHEAVKSSRFDTDNATAVPVWERASTSFAASSQAIGTGTTKLVGRHKGRKSVVLSVPVTITTSAGTSSPKGIQFAHDPNLVDTNAGFQLNPGDSVQIDSEAEVFVGVLPGNTVGYVQYLEIFNVSGGPEFS